MRRRTRASADNHSPVRQIGRGQFRYVAIGLHMLVAYWVLAGIFPAQGLSLKKVLVSSLLLLSALWFAMQIVAGSARRRHGSFGPLSSGLLALLLIWCLITIIRGIELDTSRLFTLVAHPGIGGLIWLLPFAVYIGRQPGVLQALLPVFRAHALIGIPLCMWLIVDVTYLHTPIEESVWKFSLALFYAVPVVLLTGIGRRIDRSIYLAALVLTAIAHYFLQNRTGVAVTLVILIIFLGLGRAQNFNRLTTRLLVLLIVTITLVVLGADYVLPRLSAEWLTDTRSFLWLELIDDLNQIELIIGRGALGTYYSPYFNYTSIAGLAGDSEIRQLSEVGYLHVVLKAGLIGVALYLMTGARAVYTALFLENKRLAFGLAIFLSMHLVIMLVSGQPHFSPTSVVYWILVGFALSAGRASSKGNRNEGHHRNPVLRSGNVHTKNARQQKDYEKVFIAQRIS